MGSVIALDMALTLPKLLLIICLYFLRLAFYLFLAWCVFALCLTGLLVLGVLVYNFALYLWSLIFPSKVKFEAEEETFSEADERREEERRESRARERDFCPFSVLGVSSTATRGEILRAYRERMKANHPDRVAGLDPEIQAFATNRAKMINEAYEQAMRSVG